jgi:hypothetical protein
MAINIDNINRKMFKFYEGLCSSTDFPKEIAKVLSLGVKTNYIKDDDGNILEEPVTIKSKNWDIVYPTPDSSLNIDFNNLTDREYKEKILNQINKISDTVILKTETTKKDLDITEFDDLTVDADSNSQSRIMYLEIYKPTYIANPEEYPLDCERNGITPKLITKELYENSLKVQKNVIEDIKTKKGDTKQITLTQKDDDSIQGSIEGLSYDECDKYVKKISDICKNPSFSTPTNNTIVTQSINDKETLAKIKQDDAELYELILNTLKDGRGIEPKQYSLLFSLDIMVSREENGWMIAFKATQKLNIYSVEAGVEYKVKYMPLESLIPEFYLDGIYIPINTNYYHTDGQRIIFDESFSFEESSEGILVIRYSYDTSGNNVISERRTMLNNHYVLMRLFDEINDENDGPKDNVYNTSGELVQTNSHISPWSKLSWYQDFEEIMIDTIDTDISITNIHDGAIFVPLETPGLNADTKMRYWINTNNDRFSLIVMGNPSLDYERDRHLVSACYCGAIDSFENSINDTAGNFALFTSSSTEPCNTILKTEPSTIDMKEYSLTQTDIDNKTYDENKLKEFINECSQTYWSGVCKKDNKYVIDLPDKYFFNREVWPKYLITKDGVPVTPLITFTPDWGEIKNGKTSTLIVPVENGEIYDSTYTIHVMYSYYKEKFFIISGVSRDVFGNVIDVDKIKDYGINTSDGVTSIMMYHTRSKAYYQKHHMLFATTEEYMSKVMYGKSSYTGEYYADRIKITHSNDGLRGTLSDILVIDSSSLYSLDELVVNKDFEKSEEEYEETYMYFPITAPYSPLSDSPNSRYGLALKKAEIEPKYIDEDIILKLAVQTLDYYTEHWSNVENNIYPINNVDGCSVYWSIVPNTAWYGKESNKTNYNPLQLAIINTSEYKGNESNLITPESNVVLNQGTIKSDGINSYINISGFEPKEEDIIMYGISSEPITSIGHNAHIKAVLYDGTSENEAFEYNIDGVPCVSVIDEELPGEDIKILNAAPDKYLVLYSVNKFIVSEEDIENGKAESTELDKKKYIINKFACIPLKNEENDNNWLLQYPCLISIWKEGGQGKVIYNDQELDSVSINSEYNGTIEIPLAPAQGYSLKKVTIIDATTLEDIETFTEFKSFEINSKLYQGVRLENIINNIQVKVLFAANE